MDIEQPNMAGEDASEISLEETNKLRIKLGLRPIPVPGATAPEPSAPPEQHAEHSPKNRQQESAGKAEISLEETNKLRASLGLKPIPIPSAAPDSAPSATSTSYVDQEEQAYKNWQQMKNAEDTKKRKETIEEKIKQKQEEALRRRAMGAAKTLTQEATNQSTVDWLKKMQNAQKKNASGGINVTNKPSKPQKPALSEYTADDLKGIKVAHDIDELDAGRDIVLTLKDGSVLDDEDDVLESSDLVSKEKLKKKLDAKKGLNRLNYEDDEEAGNGILSKYNDITKETKDSAFTLDGPSVVLSSKAPVKTLDKKPSSQTPANIDFQFSDIISTLDASADYQNSIPGGKAPKIKKKKKKSKQETSINISASMSRKRQREEDSEPVSVDDDEQLQSILAKSRRKVQRETKKKKIETPQEIAEKIQEEEVLEPEQDTDSNGLIVVNKTTDFLAGIKQASEEAEAQELNENKKRVQFSLDSSSVEVHKEEPEETSAEPAPLKVDASIVAPDAPVGGVAAALNLLRSRGFIKQKTAEELADEENRKKQRMWAKDMAKERILRDIELSKKREKLRATSGYDKLSHKMREALARKENQERELVEAKEAQKRFENYKPDIKLEYRDEDGRLLSTKDAYRHLSHQFHGVGPGKGKIEKKLKRDEEERKQISKSLFGNDEEDKSKGPVYGVRLQ